MNNSKSNSPADFPYADILHASRPIAKSPMSIDARAAQFAPYAALSGHQEIIRGNELAAEQFETREIIDLDNIP